MNRVTRSPSLWAAMIGLMIMCAGMLFGGPAQAGVLTNYAENKTVDALLRGQSLGAPATMYIGLTTDTCTDVGNGTEPAGGAYARVAVTSSLANWAGTQGAGTTVASTGTGGTTSNNALISFPESTASWGNMQSVRWYDASTAGNAWICIDLSSAFNVSGAGVTLKFNAGTLQFQIDN
ncbi:phage tail fiber protein [Denitromonas halophila]|uniref:Uncharacterized protein n=1 Tax=Denitromonas halophila TaxID=1629404 RepID=A0A557QX87_9RHOO|nr:hypothetical protein [Denitromonas halophila]TVO57532.1 hypothetical protein FHP91_07600 [Denitromonas halophila]